MLSAGSGFALGIGQEIFVGALEVIDLPVLEMPDARGDFVEHVIVVGDQEDGPFVLLQGDVERVDGFQIQVVGRLVQHQEIGLLQHQPAEDQPGAFAAGKRDRGLECVFAAEQHPPEEPRNLFLRRLRIELPSQSITVVPLACRWCS